jgi:pSer/pThr/pTyr-binding forkhead associated (FHA) protein
MSQSMRLTLYSPSEKFIHKSEGNIVTIGRSLSCHFVVPKDDLSREHCVLEQDGNQFYLTDKGSKNGVLVDRVRIPPNGKVRISARSHIVLANMYILKVNEEAETRSANRPAPLELEESSVSLEIAPSPYRKRPESRKRNQTAGENRSKENRRNFENIKMIVGFLLILSFILYQAFGR